MHFLNNGLAVLVSHYTANLELAKEGSEVVALTFNQVMIYLIIGLLFITLGSRLLKRVNKTEKVNNKIKNE